MNDSNIFPINDPIRSAARKIKFLLIQSMYENRSRVSNLRLSAEKIDFCH